MSEITTPDTPDEREAKLPQWAQSKLNVLRHDRDGWKRKALAGETGRTNTFAGTPFGAERKSLPDDGPVTFVLDNGDSLSARLKRGNLEIMAHSLEGRRLVVFPEVSNVVVVSTVHD